MRSFKTNPIAKIQNKITLRVQKIKCLEQPVQGRLSEKAPLIM